MSKFNFSYILQSLSHSDFVGFFKKWFKLNRWTAIAFILIGAMGLSFIINNRLQMTVLLNELEKLRKEKQSKANELKILQAELIKLQNGERITGIAETKLGMVKNTKAPKDIK